MANSTIGKLSVLVSGDASQFEKTLKQAEKSATGFASKLASPATGLLSAVSGIGGILSAPFGAIIEPLKQLAAMAPGGELALTAAGITHLAESTENAVHRLTELGNAAHKTGLDPAFLRSLQIAAGPAGDDIDKMVVKFERFVQKIRIGERDMTSNKTIQEKYGGLLDLDKLTGSSPENAIRSFIDSVKKIDDPFTRNSLLIEAWGKSGAEAFKVFETNLPDIEEKVKKLGLAEPTFLQSAKAIKGMEKELKLLTESAENKAMNGPGLLSKSASVNFAKGNWVQGIHDWMDSFEAMLPDWMMGNDVKKRMDELRTGKTEYGPSLPPELEQKYARDAQARQNRFNIAKTTEDWGQALDDSIESLGKPAYWSKILEARKLPGITEQDIKRLTHQFDWADAAQMAFANRTPDERYASDAARIRTLMGLGGPLGGAAGERALDAAFGSAFGSDSAISLARQQLAAGNRNPTLAVQGSQEFYRAIDDAANNREGKTDMKALVEQAQMNLTKQQEILAENKEATGELRKLNDNKPVVMGIAN